MSAYGMYSECKTCKCYTCLNHAVTCNPCIDCNGYDCDDSDDPYCFYTADCYKYKFNERRMLNE